jgi:Lon protease-like protein
MTGEELEDNYRDDEENPLSRGIDSVSWLPPLSGPRPPPLRSVFDPSAAADDDDDDDMEGGITETLPLFPLGGVVYTPNSEHVLNIFEPRYRQMYNDILMNGSKRFVVAMCHPSEEGRFAKVGVLFSLEELKEVSGMTADRVKYICNHRVTGRVRLHEVLNPEAWESRDTYLKVRGTIIDDTGLLNREGKEEDEDDLDESIAKKLVSAGECFCPFVATQWNASSVPPPSSSIFFSSFCFGTKNLFASKFRRLASFRWCRRSQKGGDGRRRRTRTHPRGGGAREVVWRTRGIAARPRRGRALHARLR